MDPYLTLGVPRSATQDEVKKAFRAKAQKYHPDVVGATASAAELATAEAKFKEANAAYDVSLCVHECMCTCVSVFKEANAAYEASLHSPGVPCACQAALV